MANTCGKHVNPDVASGVGIATVWSAGIGLAGALIARLTRRPSFQWSLTTVTLVAVASVTGGVVATAKAVLVSQYDFRVIVFLAVPAGLVSTLFSVLIARQASQAMIMNRAMESTAQGATTGLPVAATERSAEHAQGPTPQVPLDMTWREHVVCGSRDLHAQLRPLRAMAQALEHDEIENPEHCYVQMRQTVDRLTQTVAQLSDLTYPTCQSLPGRPAAERSDHLHALDDDSQSSFSPATQ